MFANLLVILDGNEEKRGKEIMTPMILWSNKLNTNVITLFRGLKKWREEKGNQGNMLMIEASKIVVLTARDLIHRLVAVKQ